MQIFYAKRSLKNMVGKKDRISRSEKSKKTVIRQNEKKAALVRYKGGKCCVCGYNKHNGALDFHHVGSKSFALGNNRDLSLKNLKKEVDKTILVCKNCHAELHAGLHEKYK